MKINNNWLMNSIAVGTFLLTTSAGWALTGANARLQQEQLIQSKINQELQTIRPVLINIINDTNGHLPPAARRVPPLAADGSNLQAVLNGLRTAIGAIAAAAVPPAPPAGGGGITQADVDHIVNAINNQSRRAVPAVYGAIIPPVLPANPAQLRRELIMALNNKILQIMNQAVPDATINNIKAALEGAVNHIPHGGALPARGAQLGRDYLVTLITAAVAKVGNVPNNLYGAGNGLDGAQDNTPLATLAERLKVALYAVKTAHEDGGREQNLHNGATVTHVANTTPGGALIR